MSPSPKNLPPFERFVQVARSFKQWTLCRLSSKIAAAANKELAEKGSFTDTVYGSYLPIFRNCMAIVDDPRSIWFGRIRPLGNGLTGRTLLRFDNAVAVPESALGSIWNELAGVETDGWSERDVDLVQLLSPILRNSDELCERLTSLLTGIDPFVDNWSATTTVNLSSLDSLETEFGISLVDHDIAACDLDSYSTAFAIAGIPNENILSGIDLRTLRSKTLLEALHAPYPIEDQLIEFDSRIFPGFVLEADWVQAREFRYGERTLSIINLNRRQAETALGVDLLYWNHTFDAFVFVQYKVFDNVGEDVASKAVWALQVDQHMFDQLNSLETLAGLSAVRKESMYRVCGDPAFFKLCYRRRERVNGKDLIPGIYLTTAHIRTMLKSGELAGPRGGTRIEESKLSRRWDNDKFVSMVSDGWVGTSGVSVDIIRDVVDRSLDAGRSVNVALSGERRRR